MTSRIALGFILVCAIQGAAAAETRCGWLANPTPGNFFLTDRDGSWTLAAQGRPQPPGLDLVPDLSAHDYVATNGNYGYACACVDARFDGDRTATRLSSVRQLPLATCSRDGRLPKP